jgi:hypothetical protein
MVLRPLRRAHVLGRRPGDQCDPGAFVYGPRDVPHTFITVTSEEAHFLLVTRPFLAAYGRGRCRLLVPVGFTMVAVTRRQLHVPTSGGQAPAGLTASNSRSALGGLARELLLECEQPGAAARPVVAPSDGESQF